jgi:hypothetical protein
MLKNVLYITFVPYGDKKSTSVQCEISVEIVVFHASGAKSWLNGVKSFYTILAVFVFGAAANQAGNSTANQNFFHPGYRILIFSIPDPGSASKNASILTQKNFSKL